jgi:glycerophosphoryl diester phosphodiesterase
VQSFDWRVLRAVARLEPRLRLQALANDLTFYRGSAWLAGLQAGRLPSAARRAGFDALALPRSMVTRELMAGARRRGLEVLGYTIDAPATMRALMALGADGVITDHPDRLRRELDAIP